MVDQTIKVPGSNVEAALWVLAAVALGGLVAQSVNPQPIAAVGFNIDRLTCTLALLVAGVGAVTFRFARRYLLGEQHHTRFLMLHASAVVSAMVFMLASNLILLYAAWTLTSLVLHRLLTHYAHRPEAWPPARKKFLISRIGDVALVSAILIIAFGYQTTDLQVFLSHAIANPHTLSSHAVAVLVAIAAITKSAQFPFHSWLPETMEAPTPVSALMHAGIINAGGALVLKFAPVVAASPSSMILLTLIGLVTAILGMTAMWAQTNIKRTLAWSTVSQMGFMMIQLGLAAFPAAVLHIVGHGCYKAWKFLSSGEINKDPVPQPLHASSHLLWVACGLFLSAGAVYGASWLLGFNPAQNPGKFAMTAVLVMAIAQVWPILMARLTPATISIASAITVGGSFLAMLIYQQVMYFYAPIFTSMVPIHSTLAWIVAWMVVIAMLLSILFHSFLPIISSNPVGKAFRIHALHGFYGSAIADRFVRMIWKKFSPAGVHANA